MTTEQLYNITFWATIIFLAAGMFMGLAAIWFEDIWKNRVVEKLFWTDVVLTCSSLAIAIVTKLLG